MLGNIDLHRIAVLAIDTIGVWLIIVVAMGSRKNEASRLFLLMCIAMFGWVNFAYLARIVNSGLDSVLYLRIAWVVTPPFFLFLYYFSVYFFQQTKKYYSLSLLLTVITIILSIATGLTDLVISDRKFVNGLLAIEYGKVMWPYLIGVVVIILSTVHVLFNELRSADPLKVKMIRPFLYGLSLFYIANFIFNISLPIFFGITRFYFFGDYSTIILIALVAYSVVRHQFLEVKVALSTFLVSLIGMLLVIDLVMLSNTMSERLYKAVVILCYSVIAILLIRTTLKENRQSSELRTSIVRMQELLRQERDMIDIMGHELRTPLSIARLNFPRLMKYVKPKPGYTERVPLYEERIQDALDRESRLIETLLSATKLENNKVELNKSKVTPGKVIEKSINAFANNAAVKGISLTRLPDKDLRLLPSLYADPVRLQEVMDNLVSNAVKYTMTGSVTVSACEEKDHIRFSVTDTGPGIPPEAIPHLGKKFYRVSQYLGGEDETKSLKLVRPGGTGLGLFVVFGLVKAHGGTVQVSSEVGQGSTFSFTVPKFNGQQPAKSRQTSKAKEASPDLFARFGLNK